jgi:hypothetical protein
MSARRWSAPRCVPFLPALGLVVTLVVPSILSLAETARADADHLVLTEIVAVERYQGGVQRGSPFIELANPTGAEIALDGVYLSTAQDIINGKLYWTMVEGADSGGGSGGNVHCTFPRGMSIAAGDTIVIAINGTTQFQAAYGFVPDLELFEDGNAPDQVPEMREVFWGSIGAGLGSNRANAPAFGPTVESVVLYAWDGASDLVDDLDYIIYGADTRARVDKTGVSIDGPDVDEAPSTYANDTAVNLQHTAVASAPTFGRALARRTFAEDGEVVAGGNGLTGHDETSENLPASWALTTTQNPAAPPGTWYFTAPIVTDAVNAPAAPYAGTPVTLTAHVLSHAALREVVFRYTLNDGATQQLAGTAGSGNAWTAQLTGLAVADTVKWWLEAQTTDGIVAVYPLGGLARALRFGVAEPPAPGDGPAKLLFTEVCTTPTPGEFVEIYNPNPFAVPLADYYLTDAIHAPASEYYWRIAEGNPSAVTIGGGAFNDFHSRFPTGATIAAGDTITVALMGSDAFETFHLVSCDYELFEDGSSDDIPNMAEVFPGSIGDPDPTYGLLTNESATAGEPIILYYWDGTTDLVTDIDILLWGGGTSYLFSKNGVSVDGPDADTTPTPYEPETPVGSIVPLLLSHAAHESYTRIDGSEGTQRLTGGNGVVGRDELSENWAGTFVVAPSSPARPSHGGGGGNTTVKLDVPARTFLPRQGEVFPISFEVNSAWQTRLRILDLQGRLVVSLYDSEFERRPASAKTIEWDGHDQTFAQVRAGMYVVHLSVVDPVSGEEKIETAPVVVATRLQK